MKLKKYVGVVKADADHNQSTASQPMHAEWRGSDLAQSQKSSQGRNSVNFAWLIICYNNVRSSDPGEMFQE